MRSFDTWTYEQVEDAFGIELILTSPRFTDWLDAADCSPNALEKATLDEYRNLLFDEVKNWNEDELKLFFIGPVLGLIHFKTAHFKPFTQRTLTIETETVSASGKVDFMLAKGKMIPKIPYFCLHEYKANPRRQENRCENDPLGQLLIGMVAAQAKKRGRIADLWLLRVGSQLVFCLARRQSLLPERCLRGYFRRHLHRFCHSEKV